MSSSERAAGESKGPPATSDSTGHPADGLYLWLIRRQLVEELGRDLSSLGVIEKEQHRAEVRSYRPHQLEAVLLGRRECPLVGSDSAIGSVWLQSQPAKEATAALLSSVGRAKPLLVDVDQRSIVGRQRAVRLPAGESLGRGFVDWGSST